MSATPNSDNLYLGAGSVFFDRFDSSGVSTGMRHLGNVDKLEITHSVETKEKKNAMDGARATYAEVIVGSAAEISMDLSEFTKENIALAILGRAAALTQSAEETVTDRAVGPVAANVQLDVWYDMGSFNPTVTAVKQGATTLNAAAYEVNAEAGMIRLLSSYTGTNKAAEATAITWSGSVPAIAAGANRWKAHGLGVSQIKGRLRFISAANQAAGPRVMVDVWICGLNPDGALSLITEDFGALPLKGKVYADTTKSAGEQYYRIVNL